MFLSDTDIKKAVKAGKIILRPFRESQLQPASYDIRLGNNFIVNDESATHIVDPVKKIYAKTREMVHNTAGIINPGHFLHITFEITNQNNVPIILRPGMEIAQITFSMLSSPTRQSYRKNGRYAKNNWRHFVPAKGTRHKAQGTKKK